MIEIRWNGGRFGNQMFLYVFARLIATKFGYTLNTPFVYNEIINTTPNPKGQEYHNDPIELCDVGIPNYMFPTGLHQRKYIIHGYFQNGQYYENLENLIKGFFDYQIEFPLNEKDIVMHVRLSDYKEFGPGGTIIHPNWYCNILDKEEFDKIYIVTDDPGNKEYFRRITKRFNCEIVSDTPKHDFHFLMKFKKMIMANSTFSWWAGMLGEHEKIYIFKPWMRNTYDYRNMDKIKNSVVLNGVFY
ncbi:MAG: alpha-1,2-fucosyltransferase [Bacillota bacterium]